jgi:diguanylate cyclase (GGDEF)-like protein
MELLHETERTRVTRVQLASGSVIRKEPLGADADKRLRQERAILRRLSTVSDVSRLAVTPSYPGSLMLADFGGVALAQVPMPVAVEEMTRIGLALARVVAAVHRCGVVHRDISPANVLLVGDGREPCLIDFAVATTFAEVRPEFTHHNEIVGTLPYLAPEQTGRTGRPVDQRADLYALGATLYELATGAPPFGTGDALRLSHDHLARVPVAPTQANPAVPAALSGIIMHLLEKEPDSRYQTAEGLIHDLEWLRRRPSNEAGSWRVGERDFALRLLPPSRPVGRTGEIAALRAAFSGAVSGRCRGVLVSGTSGVGKTSLIDELRPIVTADDGWFVAGKFDQYRRDQEFDGVRQAFRGLGRLLLAEPEDELADLRERLLFALGANAGLVSAVVPEFATLLQVPAELGDPLTAEVRAQRNAVAILRAVASRKRPVVFVIDDLQWAGRAPLGFIDMLLSDESIDGLLLVGAYREDEADEMHPLTAMLSGWRRRPVALEQLRLDNLPPASLAAMVAEMLRLDQQRATELADMITPRTKGNPYDSVELLNALRHDGVLRPGPDGWDWDATVLQGLGQADVAEILVERIGFMPPPTRALLETMACIGGRADVELLQVAIDRPAGTVEEQLLPALDDGLLVMEPGVPETARFRHDRVQEAVTAHLAPERQRALRLELGRRFGRRPDLFAVAAQQYLTVVDTVHDPQERQRVAELLRRAAEQAQLLSNHPMVNRLLTAALTVTDPADRQALIELHTGQHLALYSLGRLDQADDVYHTIDQLSTEPAQRAQATLTQVSSLTNRYRHREAISLGLEQLRQFGLAVPSAARLGPEIDRGLDMLYRWLDEGDETDDLERPEITDPSLLATTALINRLMPPAFFFDQAMMAWLSLQALRTWAEHGPGRTLLGPISHLAYATIAIRQDYRTSYRLMNRLLAVGEARRYEPDTSQARFLNALGPRLWFTPLEENMGEAERAREGLIQGGDLQNACYTYYISMGQFLDFAPTLDVCLGEVESALLFARRTGNDQAAETFEGNRRLARLLSADNGEPATLDDAALDSERSNDVSARKYLHRSIAAALLGDQAQLSQNTASLMPLLPAIVGMYPVAQAQLLRGLALAGEVRAAAPDDRRSVVSELDEVIEWVAARAADAPVNFVHFLRLLEAERAWAVNDFQAAAYAFDVAQRDVGVRERPWHRALTFERAARFYLAHGMESTGYPLLAQARRDYLDWGATAKVNQLDWAYPTLQSAQDIRSEQVAGQPGGPPTHRSTITAGAIDLLGILTTSQALSSQKTIDGLRSRVVEVVSGMTGATGVHLLIRNNDDNTWLLAAAGADNGGTIPLGDANAWRHVPLSAIRYVERTREPLVVADAVHDDRFARDPHFVDLDCCSLLVVPLINRGVLAAFLLLENRLIRGAFSAERLDGVMLIAGQLAVSLDNAMVYASLEGKVAQRTEQLADANQRLRQLSVTDALTGVANRRRLQDVLDREWRLARRTSTPVGLAMVDIDHFKLYNDHYGHASGDRCLQRVAASLRQNIRDGDLVARYGGEEFAIVMPATDLATAEQLAEQLHASIVDLAEPHALGAARIVTVSIGVAAMVPPENAETEYLIEAADVQLYRAKRSGRNHVKV